MDHPLSQEALVRPWRRATVLATTVAVVELVVLVVGGIVLLARPLSHHVEKAAKQKSAPVAEKVAPVRAQPAKPEPIGRPKLARAETPVLVLNGNGRTGAASLEATLVRSRGYPVTAVGNAKRATYARSVVMYRPRLRAEGARLAKDLGIALFSPLDGLKPAALGGAKLVVVVGDN